MSISKYYKEREKLLAAQNAERAILLDHGVAAADIDELHRKDYEAWKADRVYAKHNAVSSEELGEEALSFAWMRRNRNDEHDDVIGGFLDSIGNEKLLAALKGLDPDELALVEACWLNGISQKDYARQIGRSPSSVNEKLKRLKARLQKKFN